MAPRLVREFGNRVFKDVNTIELGMDFRSEIERHLKGARMMLVVIGAGWLDARDGAGNRRLDDPVDQVRVEIQTALDRQMPVIPLLLDGTLMPSELALPDGLKRLSSAQSQEILADPHFDGNMQQLLAAVRNRLGG